MKFPKLIFVLFFIILYFVGCFKKEPLYNEVKENLNSFSKIVACLSDSLFPDIKDTLLSIQNLKSIAQIKDEVNYLEKKGLLKNERRFNNNCVYFKNKHCISFFIKREKTILENKDVFLMFEDLVPLLSGLGSYYSVNQEEHISKLSINVSNIEGLFNYVTVAYKQPVYND